MRTRNRLTAETHFATTADGWKIALYRYVPAGGGIKGQCPVFLCHGLGANRYNLDAPGRLSMARWLCRQGFETWVVELRGAGKSSRPRMWNDKKFDWNFDHYVMQDVPAALALVAQVSGHPDVHWIGHSMGGMVAYAYLMTHDQAPIRTMTAIASPAFAGKKNPVIAAVAPLAGILKIIKKLPYEGTGIALVPAMPLFKETVGHLFGNPRNLSNRDLAKLIVLTPTNLPTSLIRQFADWYVVGGFTGQHNNVDYVRELHKVAVPSFIIGGSRDILTPPGDMKHTFNQIGAADKKFMVFGKRQGSREEYGHIDLVLGRRASEEVWPHILTWLVSH